MLWTNLKALLSLRRDVDELKKDFQVIEAEWNDWFDRFRRLHAAIARRQQREAEAARSPETEDTQPGGGDVPDSPDSTLTPAQLKWQKRIMERRARMGARPNGGG
jgi:hypothetical protein